MSMKGVIILFALFSLGSLMPAKHWLVETEDGGDDSEGVTETRSKIQVPVYRYYIFFPADLMENKKWVWVPDEGKEATGGFGGVATPPAIVYEPTRNPCTNMIQSCYCGGCDNPHKNVRIPQINVRETQTV